MATRETFTTPEGWLEAIKAEMKDRDLRPVDLATRLRTKEPQISKLLNGRGMRSLANQVGEYLGIPPFVPCSSKLQARAMLRVKVLAETRPRVLAKWMDALEASVDDQGETEADIAISHVDGSRLLVEVKKPPTTPPAFSPISKPRVR